MNDLSEAEHKIRSLTEAIDTYLAGLAGPGIAVVRSGIDRLRSQAFRTVPTKAHPSLRHLAVATDHMAHHGRGDLARAISAAAPLLHWVPYDSYPRDLIGAQFADDHAFASIAVHSVSDEPVDFDLGLFVIGPNLLYRDHNHAAPELYAPLTGPHGFRFASGERLNWLPAHQPVWNEPFRQHAIKTGPIPFLCIYAWTADVNEPAQIIVEPDWAELDAATAP